MAGGRKRNGEERGRKRARYRYRDVCLMAPFSSQSVNWFSLHREAVSFNAHTQRRWPHTPTPDGARHRRAGLGSCVDQRLQSRCEHELTRIHLVPQGNLLEPSTRALQSRSLWASRPIGSSVVSRNAAASYRQAALPTLCTTRPKTKVAASPSGGRLAGDPPSFADEHAQTQEFFDEQFE